MAKGEFRGQGTDKYEAHQKWWLSLKDAIQQAHGVKPTVVIGQNDYRTELYREQLRRLVKGIIEVECTNKEWDYDYFKETLLFEGKICITDTQIGIIPQECGVHGDNVYHRQRFVTIRNHILGSLDRTIGEDCSLIYLMDNYRFWNFSMLCDVFANKLAMCDSSIDVNLLNTKVAYLVDAPTQKIANELKQIFDKVNQGDPVVFHGTGEVGARIEVAFNNVKQNYIAADVQAEKRAILNEFMSYIGINNVNMEKKERLLLDEVNGNNAEIMCNLKYIREVVERGVRQTNEMFPGLALKIRFPFIEKMEEAEEAANAMKQMQIGGGDDANERTGRNDSNGSKGRDKRN